MTDSDSYVEARFQRSVLRRRATLVAIGAVVVVAVVVLFVRSLVHEGRDADGDRLPKIVLTPAQKQQLDATIAKSRAHLDELDRPWHAAIATVDPRQTPFDAPPCTALRWAAQQLAGNPQSLDWGSWQVITPLRFNASSSASLSRTPFPLEFVAKDAPLPDHSPEAAHYRADLDALADGGSPYATFEQRIHAATVDQLRVTDVLVRLDIVVEPKLQTSGRFRPGTLVGSVWATTTRRTSSSVMLWS